MEWDFSELPKADRYKVMASCITPRPIAWVTSMSGAGVLNAAPYSFFNMVGDDPPTVVLGIMGHAEGRFKDTARNIVETREFVINLVDEAHAEAMNLTCIDAPPEVSEIALAGLQTTPSLSVKPPRIAGVPASFECRLLRAIDTGPLQRLVIAEVVHAFVRDDCVLDAARCHIDTPAMNLIARLHGSGWYSRQTDLFQMVRPSWKQT